MLWLLRATEAGWSSPEPVTWPMDDRPVSPQQPVLTDDGTLYFVDERDDGAGHRDVYRARWVDGAVAGVSRLDAPVSTAADEAGVYVSADGRIMIVARTAGPGHRGGDDLYVHTSTAAGWSDAVNLGLPVNTFANEYGPWLEGDDRLWFTSDRFGSGDLFSVAIMRRPDGGLTVARP